MLFSSLLFIFGFLPGFLLVYYVAPRKFRNLVALLASYFFYAWGAPKFVFILLFSSVVDYALGRLIESKKEQKKLFLIISLLFNLGLLGYAKYANFFVGEFNNLLETFGLNTFHWTHIVLPIGISFFTFQKISYIVDVYSEKTAAARKFTDFALYVALFPQLIAGPIVRYHDIAEQIKERVYDSEKFVYGVYRFCLGLSKKVLVANQIGIIVDTIFSLDPVLMPISYAWVGAISYAMQIYFDFSGYSDMAIGLGSMMGFRFLENFDKPYISQSFTEFWRRWHISLSRFMREYLYIPLGGNRVTRKRMYLNLWIVFLLSGFWHGASWTFVLWGAWHGFFLMLDKMRFGVLQEKIPKFFKVISTFVLVLFGWVLFRSESLNQAYMYLWRMIDISSLGGVTPSILWAEFISNRAWLTLALAVFMVFLPVTSIYQKALTNIRQNVGVGYKFFIKYGLSVVFFILSVLSLVNASFNPFIYFRF